MIKNGTITPVELLPRILRLDYVGGTYPIYLGRAEAGSATSDNVWQIRKLVYDGNNNVVSMLLAGGTRNYKSVWDDRASLSYS